MKKEQIDKYNDLVLKKLSVFLNNYSDYINNDMINNLIEKCNLDEEEAFKYIIFSVLGFDMCKDREIFEYYFKFMIKKLDKEKYQNNSYYKDINISNINLDNWKCETKEYKPYETFVFNDLIKMDDGRIIPQIGFFNESYKYPCVLENNREWMLITPNEIETMSKVINDSFGNVLTYGLGLGYFPYMISLKENVTSITIVEKDKNVIKLFEEFILPQFEYKNKIKIICKDAFEFKKNNTEIYDLVFVDIWHDPSDGIDLYLKFKKLENKQTIYKYWIEDTIKCYID